MKYFEMKLTKQEILLESSGTGPITKVPKRKKINNKDSVESIANNVQTLINFGREQRQKLTELKKIPMNNKKTENQTLHTGATV